MTADGRQSESIGNLSGRYTRAEFIGAAGKVALAAWVAPSILAACVAGSSNSKSGTTNFSVAFPADVSEFDTTTMTDPYSFTVIRHIYASLVAYKTQSTSTGFTLDRTVVEPYLADYTVSPDGKTITFTLRGGLIFPSANRLTADDVVYTMQRHLAVNQIGAFLLNKAGVTNPSQIIKKSDQEVVMTFPQPNGLTLKILAFPDMGILDSKVVQSHATSDDTWAQTWLKSNVAGLGPYVMTKRVPSQSMTFQPNNQFFAPGKLPWTAQIVPSPETASLLVQRGSADFAVNLSEDIIQSLKNASGIRVLSFPSDGADEMFLNTRRAPFNDVRVRQAVWYSVPWDQLVAKVYFGLAQVAKSSLTLGEPGYDTSGWPYTYDPVKAKALLAQAGYPNGIAGNFNFNNQTSRFSRLAEVLRESFAQSGITLKPQQMTAAQLTDAFTSKPPTFETGVEFGWPWIGDPEYSMWLVYAGDGGANYTGYSDPRFDAMLNQLATLNGAARLDLIRQMQSTLAPEAAMAHLAQPNYEVVGSTRVTGYLFPADGTNDFRHVTGV
jgi:peptide/nickel transport system substrate-binding protein